MPLTSHQAATEAEPEIAGNHQQETHPLDGRDALVVFKASTCNQSPTNKTLQLSGRQTTEAVEPSGTTKKMNVEEIVHVNPVAEQSSQSTNDGKLLASSDELMDVFKEKLSTIIKMDHVVNTDVNDLKLLNDEFQFLHTTNGVYLDPKFTENLKTEVKDDKVMDKIVKRQKQITSEAAVFDKLRQDIIDNLVDAQTEREYLLQATKDENFPGKISESDSAYVSSFRADYVDPTDESSEKVKKVNKGGRPRNGTTKVTPAVSIRGKRGKKPTSLLATAIDNNVAIGKRKRKPTSRSDEFINEEEIENKLSEIFNEEDNRISEEKIVVPQPRKRRRRGPDGLLMDLPGQPTTSKSGSSGKNSKTDNDDDDTGADDDEGFTNGKLSVKQVRSLAKQYDNNYLSIWKDLSRKDNPKAYRLFQQTAQAKVLNLKKTAQLATRESSKWQIKTTKAQKDQTAKAKRCMREMLSFWKKNEKEERMLRLKAEQDALQKAKKEEEERESRRQARKLNFLINQTELYSHFIGKKIKTSEIEGDMGDKRLGSVEKDASKDDDKVDLSMATTDFTSVNFDDENEESLHKMAAANAQSALLEAKNKAEQFNFGVKRAGDSDDSDSDDEMNEGEMNFQNPSKGDISVEQPKLLNCTLKEYQRKGLNWLANLYEQGINGILADEMGLGKTVQSISILAYLAETHNIWGPFLVVTPASTLHNWQQEITRFVPDFNVLPYWGTAKDRKVLRKFWDRKNIIYNRNSPFHVVVTSYQLVVADQAYFQKMKWQYMILDEAQAIKSSQSSRWKSLLSLQCRNRLLLTGTPIQNNMQELWALLHFIMPSLFDSHDEFSEWFSKDIEAHAASNSKLNEEQLRRLHAILKPFMLRRIKKNVQSELGDKIEIDVYCDLTNRQKKLYRMLRAQINVVDLIENNKRIGKDEEVESLMNVVMQFRKVCNHPDLFERADTRSAFCFVDYPETKSLIREVNDPVLNVNYNTKNLIQYQLPKLIVNDLLMPAYENKNITDKERFIKKMFNMYQANNYQNDKESELNILKFVKESPNDIERIVSQNLLHNAIENRNYGTTTDDEKAFIKREIYNTDEKNSLILSENSDKKIPGYLKTVKDSVSKEMYMKTCQKGAYENAIAPPIELVCSRENMDVIKQDSLFDPKIRQALLPLSLDTQAELIENNVQLKHWPKAEMLPDEESENFGGGTIRLPAMERFVLESAKLKKLDQMLVDLKKGGHKCLIYFQMTRMMDLMEEYLTYRQYQHIRLDGSSKLSDRRDLVNDWQTNPELFIFLLSTRAGGLGINLTAADTVIFYDSDWNPTIDSQAMDRAHRLGQTRQVTVYRLLVRGTIEERMRDRAKQKEHVQQVVMEGKVGEEVNEKDEKEKEKKEMALWLLEDDK